MYWKAYTKGNNNVSVSKTNIHHTSGITTIGRNYRIPEEIWENRILTNKGRFHEQFEKELVEYLGVKYLSLFANGTLALVTALQTLSITGKLITTPFSFVATTHSLWWNNIKPVFSNIEPDYFNLDPDKVEEALTPHTTAIMSVHVYGNLCKLNALKNSADINR